MYIIKGIVSPLNRFAESSCLCPVQSPNPPPYWPGRMLSRGCQLAGEGLAAPRSLFVSNLPADHVSAAARPPSAARPDDARRSGWPCLALPASPDHRCVAIAAACSHLQPTRHWLALRRAGSGLAVAHYVAHVWVVGVRGVPSGGQPRPARPLPARSSAVAVPATRCKAFTSPFYPLDW